MDKHKKERIRELLLKVDQIIPWVQTPRAFNDDPVKQTHSRYRRCTEMIGIEYDREHKNNSSPVARYQRRTPEKTEPETNENNGDEFERMESFHHIQVVTEVKQQESGNRPDNLPDQNMRAEAVDPAKEASLGSTGNTSSVWSLNTKNQRIGELRNEIVGLQGKVDLLKERKDKHNKTKHKSSSRKTHKVRVSLKHILSRQSARNLTILADQTIEECRMSLMSNPVIDIRRVQSFRYPQKGIMIDVNPRMYDVQF